MSGSQTTEAKISRLATLQDWNSKAGTYNLKDMRNVPITGNCMEDRERRMAELNGVGEVADASQDKDILELVEKIKAIETGKAGTEGVSEEEEVDTLNEMAEEKGLRVKFF